MGTVTNKFFGDNMGGTSANSYIGTTGEVFYDTTGDTPLRLSNGVTPGGIPFGITSSTRSYDPQFKAAGGLLTGAVATGNYVKQACIVHFRVNVDFRFCTNFQAASNTQMQFVLPYPTDNTTFTIRGGSLHNPSYSGGSIWHIAGIVDPRATSNNTLCKLYYSGSTTDLPMRAAVPVGWAANTTHFDISGAYQTSSLAVD